MKKNILWSLLAVMMAVVLGAGLVACSSDDEDGVVGTWIGYVDGDGLKITLVFSEDGTGTYRSEFTYKEDGRDSQGSFTYTMEGEDKGYVVDNHNEKGYFRIVDGNSMYLFERGYDSDVEAILKRQ